MRLVVVQVALCARDRAPLPSDPLSFVAAVHATSGPTTAKQDATNADRERRPRAGAPSLRPTLLRRRR